MPGRWEIVVTGEINAWLDVDSNIKYDFDEGLHEVLTAVRLWKGKLGHSIFETINMSAKSLHPVCASLKNRQGTTNERGRALISMNAQGLALGLQC